MCDIHGKPTAGICFELIRQVIFVRWYWSTWVGMSHSPITSHNYLSFGWADSPLAPWDAESPLNLMTLPVVVADLFRSWPNIITNMLPIFTLGSDICHYELDCFGSDFIGHSSEFGDPSLLSLRRFGRLTSHGNPPALEFTAMHSGPHRFYADLTLGSYSVLPYPS